MFKDAKFSRCRCYRYALWRVWDSSKATVLFIGLNPSTADEVTDDTTLTRCINFAKKWGYGGVCMANLFAYRARKPNDMLSADNPIGSQNNRWLKQLSRDAKIVIAAWGNHGRYLNRSQCVQKMIPQLYYLKLTKFSEPAHPLYLKASLKPKALNHTKTNLMGSKTL